MLLVGGAVHAGREMCKAHFEEKNVICTNGSVSGISIPFWSRSTGREFLPLLKLFSHMNNCTSVTDPGDVSLGCTWGPNPKTLTDPLEHYMEDALARQKEVNQRPAA